MPDTRRAASGQVAGRRFASPAAGSLDWHTAAYYVDTREIEAPRQARWGSVARHDLLKHPPPPPHRHAHAHAHAHARTHPPTHPPTRASLAPATAATL